MYDFLKRLRNGHSNHFFSYTPGKKIKADNTSPKIKSKTTIALATLDDGLNTDTPARYVFAMPATFLLMSATTAMSSSRRF